jgi:acyl-coenzyme A synthetase/AMP-(fatty) acid ligase
MTNAAGFEEIPYWTDYMKKAGWKLQPHQFSTYPFVGHLHFANKKDLLLPDPGNELVELVTYLSSNKNKYQQFLRKKGRHPSMDIYACFQPFNEAFKALYPFVDYIKGSLKDGDIVLNLWDRSGWTAHMLAGWFPNQQIITVWEGDKDILGYRGFDYWMSQEGQENHTIVFADFLRPLPFEGKTVSAVIGMDLLHRFNQPEILSEINRVAKDDAPIIFPHVHLTNNEPEPYFDRGCRQLHGREYQYLFDLLAPATNRQGSIFSEPSLFNWNDRTTESEKTLVSEPENKDYNACIAWLPSTAKPYLKPWRGHEQKGWEKMYLLQNPLLAIDPSSGTVLLNEKTFAGMIHELLERHQVYTKRIKASVGKVVEKDVVYTLYWALQGMNIEGILQKTQLDKEKMLQILQTLWDLDLAQAVPVGEAGFRLQTLLGHQRYILEAKEKQLCTFWQQAVSYYANEPWVKMPGEDALTYAQADELVALVKKALLAEGLKKGDKLILCAGLHPEPLLLFWAAVSLGIIVVPISTKESAARIRDYIELLQPSLAVVDPGVYASFTVDKSLRTIMTDQLNDPSYVPEFSFQSWLELAIEKEVEADAMPGPDDIAVILWTTGSTGNPKGIPVTHAQLIRSGRIMTETYHWKKTDRYFGLGGLETMSGLRHATVGIAEAGACCVVGIKQGTIYDHLQTILDEKITIITANPIFFRQLVLSAKGKLLQKSLRLALSTGNQLSSELRALWKEQTGIPLYNYYGLTETTGICIAEPPGFFSEHNNSIGIAADCLIKLVDENGNEVPNETPGELCVYGAGVFQGYYNNLQATGNSLIEGWFHTKDIAIRHADGQISLSGRISDIVKLPSGERVEIAAIEEAMQNIENLRDWAVCSIPHTEAEEIAVFIVPDEGYHYNHLLNRIRQVITETIGSYAVPSLIEPVPVIPRGNHNKLLRKELISNYFQTIKTI